MSRGDAIHQNGVVYHEDLFALAYLPAVDINLSDEDEFFEIVVQSRVDDDTYIIVDQFNDDMLEGYLMHVD